MKRHKISAEEIMATPNQYAGGRFSTTEKAELKLDLSRSGRKAVETTKRNIDERDRNLTRERKLSCIEHRRLS